MTAAWDKGGTNVATDKLKCIGCGAESTHTFDGYPACDKCIVVCIKEWPSRRITYPPLTPVQGSSILASIITRTP